MCTLSIFFVTLILSSRDIAYTLFKSVLFSTFKLTGNFKINSCCSPYTSKLALLNMETPYFALRRRGRIVTLQKILISSVSWRKNKTSEMGGQSFYK